MLLSRTRRRWRRIRKQSLAAIIPDRRCENMSTDQQDYSSLLKAVMQSQVFGVVSGVILFFGFLVLSYFLVYDMQRDHLDRKLRGEAAIWRQATQAWLTYSRFKEDQFLQPNITRSKEDEQTNKWTMKLQVLITQDELDSIDYNIEDNVLDREEVMRPNLTQAPTNAIRVKIGSNVNIACDALLDSHLHNKHRVYWYHGYHKFFDTLERDHSSRIKEAGGERNPKVLKIRNATEEDKGWYTCVVQKATGYTFASTFLNVDDTSIKESISLMDILLTCIALLSMPTFFFGITYGMYRHQEHLIRKWKLQTARRRQVMDIAISSQLLTQHCSSCAA